MPRHGRFWASIACLFTSLSLSNGSTEPPNLGAIATLKPDHSTFEITYDGKILMRGRVGSQGRNANVDQIQLRLTEETGSRGQITQHILLESSSGTPLSLIATVIGSDQAFPAESSSDSQAHFKMVRNVVGLSSNLRNNAIYDRRRDWMLEAPGDWNTQIKPAKDGEFTWTAHGPKVSLVFRPRYYQKTRISPTFDPGNTTCGVDRSRVGALGGLTLTAFASKTWNGSVKYSRTS